MSGVAGGGGGAAAERARGGLAPAPEIDRVRVRRHVIALLVVALGAVAVITLVPGLASLRSRFEHANGGWIALGVVLKVLSGVCYVLVFRGVFCARMRWRVSMEIGFAELGANAVLPVGGAGGLRSGRGPCGAQGWTPTASRAGASRSSS